MLKVEAMPLEDEQPGQKPDRRWTLLAMVIGAVCLVAVFVLRLVQAKKENPERQFRQKDGR